MRVLVAEDFEVLARAIATGLRREGMAVDVVLDGDDALESLAVTRYDVVVLDRDLPGAHGDEVCRQIVAGGCGSRVLMLTAASTVADRVDGLGLGADDYLPKPFDFAELVARIRALARRPSVAVPPVLKAGDLTVDPARRVAFRAGRRLDLSPKEFGVLECLLGGRRPDRVRRGSAGTGLGLGGRPVHHRGEDHHQAAAAEARRPAGHPHRPRGRLPGRSRHEPSGSRFALLYAGAFSRLGPDLLSSGSAVLRR